MRVQSRGPEDTALAGYRLGSTLSKGQVVCLHGELGAGKTVFVKGIARALGIDEREIMSASFTIIAEHDSTPPLYHIDLYRIEGRDDLESTGIYDYLGGEGIAVIEWAEKLDLHSPHIKVTILFGKGDERDIIIEDQTAGAGTLRAPC